MVNPSWSEEENATRQRLSVLVDGEAQTADVEGACADWRRDADARATWHAYQLIGDVLRSEDLAHPAPRDEAFLAALRTRLANEPVVLAPAVHMRRPAWRAPVAAAAGVAAVAGVVLVMRATSPIGEAAPAAALVQAPAVATAVVPVSASPAADNTVLVTDGKLIRDARLERYLAAHKQYGSSSAVSVPGVVLRSSTTQVPER